RRRHTRFSRDWSSDVCSSDLSGFQGSSRYPGPERVYRADESQWRKLPARLVEGVSDAVVPAMFSRLLGIMNALGTVWIFLLMFQIGRRRVGSECWSCVTL